MKALNSNGEIVNLVQIALANLNVGYVGSTVVVDDQVGTLDVDAEGDWIAIIGDGDQFKLTPENIIQDSEGPWKIVKAIA